MAHDAYGDLQADNITTLIKAAGVTVEPYWPGLFAKLFEKRSVGDLISNVGAGEALSALVKQRTTTNIPRRAMLCISLLQPGICDVYPGEFPRDDVALHDT